ncbi:cytochrome c3 family protein, partial [Candidatus Desantisbacteria bacterium]|nr:cytochrome c3 family protein [Candidatus Desantisbacteria bacterium]
KWDNGRSAIKTEDGRVICRSCHNPHAAVKNTSLLEYIGNSDENYINFLCKKCHKDKISTGKMQNNQGTHPVDLPATDNMKPVSKIPFDKNRKLMCFSCHMPHNAANESSSDGNDGKILRVTNMNSILCKECHEEKYADGIKQAESKGMHPIMLVPKDTVLEEAVKKGGQVGKDGVLVCSSCHNIHKGTKGTPVLIETNQNSEICNLCHKSKLIKEEDNTVTAMKHPVGQKPVNAKISKEIFDAGGKLGENGEIICALCHKPHQSVKDTQLLIMENQKNSMCLKCHSDKLTVKSSDHNLAITNPFASNLRGENVTKGGLCSACHFSHQWARSLDRSGDLIQQFCLSCHAEGKPGEKKLIGGYTHPTNVTLKNIGDGKTSLPLYPELGLKKEAAEKKVFCNTCHNVHKWSPDKEDMEEEHTQNVEGDFNNSFLKLKNDNKSSLCLDCHKDKKLVVNTEHDLNITAPLAVNIISQTAGSAGVCSACHLPHNGTNRRMWARQLSGKEDAGSQFCKKKK